jgi:hypothetical protein
MTAKTMAEVLAENMDQVFTAEYGDALAFTGDAEELAELLSAAGFGLVADAKAEALEEAADDFGETYHGNWLRTRAASIRAAS